MTFVNCYLKQRLRLETSVAFISCWRRLSGRLEESSLPNSGPCWETGLRMPAEYCLADSPRIMCGCGVDGVRFCHSEDHLMLVSAKMGYGRKS